MVKNIDKRAEVLKATLKIVEDKGIESCSVAEIAKVSQTSMGTIYYYFKNKAGLLDDLYVSIRQEASAATVKNLHVPDNAANMQSMVTMLFSNYVNFYVAQPAKFHFMTAIQTSKTYTTSSTQAYADFKLLHDLYQVGVQQAVFPKRTLMMLIACTTGACNQVIASALAQAMPLTQPIIDDVTRICWAMFTAPTA